MKTLQGKKYYRPREIARLGLIKNSRGSDNEAGNYNFILNLIKTGKLRAKNYASVEGVNYWLVPEDEIARYHELLSNVGESVNEP